MTAVAPARAATVPFSGRVPTARQADLLEAVVETGNPWSSTGYRTLSGDKARRLTASQCVSAGWLLAVGRRGGATLATVTPAGRAALARARPGLETGWSDEDRARMSCRVGSRRVGPIEVEECGEHPGDLEAYRWAWPVGAGPEDGEPLVVLPCPRCAVGSKEVIPP